MAKVTINGEVHEFDLNRTPLSEACLVEADMGCRFAEYEQDLQAGSARAVAEFVRLVWLRNGRDVPLAEILSGAVAVDLMSLKIEDGTVAEADPKEFPGPGGIPGTGGGGSRTSRRSTTSAPGS